MVELLDFWRRNSLLSPLLELLTHLQKLAHMPHHQNPGALSTRQVHVGGNRGHCFV